MDSPPAIWRPVLAGESRFECFARELLDSLAFRRRDLGRTLMDLGRDAERDPWRVHRVTGKRGATACAADILHDLVGEIGRKSLPAWQSDVVAIEVDFDADLRLARHPWRCSPAHHLHSSVVSDTTESRIHDASGLRCSSTHSRMSAMSNLT